MKGPGLFPHGMLSLKGQLPLRRLAAFPRAGAGGGAVGKVHGNQGKLWLYLLPHPGNESPGIGTDPLKMCLDALPRVTNDRNLESCFSQMTSLASFMRKGTPYWKPNYKLIISFLGDRV